MKMLYKHMTSANGITNIMHAAVMQMITISANSTNSAKNIGIPIRPIKIVTIKSMNDPL